MHSFTACGRRANEFMFAGTVHLLLGPGAELAGNGTRKDGELRSILAPGTSTCFKSLFVGLISVGLCHYEQRGFIVLFPHFRLFFVLSASALGYFQY